MTDYQYRMMTWRNDLRHKKIVLDEFRHLRVWAHVFVLEFSKEVTALKYERGLVERYHYPA